MKKRVASATGAVRFPTVFYQFPAFEAAEPNPELSPAQKEKDSPDQHTDNLF